jgi:hypothetical protein
MPTKFIHMMICDAEAIHQLLPGKTKRCNPKTSVEKFPFPVGCERYDDTSTLTSTLAVTFILLRHRQ